MYGCAKNELQYIEAEGNKYESYLENETGVKILSVNKEYLTGSDDTQLIQIVLKVNTDEIHEENYNHIQVFRNGVKVDIISDLSGQYQTYFYRGVENKIKFVVIDLEEYELPAEELVFPKLF